MSLPLLYFRRGIVVDRRQVHEMLDARHFLVNVHFEFVAGRHVVNRHLGLLRAGRRHAAAVSPALTWLTGTWLTRTLLTRRQILNSLLSIF